MHPAATKPGFDQGLASRLRNTAANGKMHGGKKRVIHAGEIVVEICGGSFEGRSARSGATAVHGLGGEFMSKALGGADVVFKGMASILKPGNAVSL